MAIYTARVICQNLSFLASNEEDADAKYNAWHYDEPCPEHDDADWDCGCFLDEDEEADHVWEVRA